MEEKDEQQDNRPLLTDQEVIEKSKKEPSLIFYSSDGRHVHNGMIFKNEKEFQEYLKAYVNITDAVLKFLKPFRFIKNLFSRKK